MAIIAGNFDRTTNPHPHENPTYLAHEIRIHVDADMDVDIGWLRYIPNQK